MLNWLYKRAESIVVKGATPCWQPVTNDIPQGSDLGSILLNIFISDLETEVECTISKIAGDNKLSCTVVSVEGQEAFTGDLDRLEHQAIINDMKFHKSKY